MEASDANGGQFEATEVIDTDIKTVQQGRVISQGRNFRQRLANENIAGFGRRRLKIGGDRDEANVWSRGRMTELLVQLLLGVVVCLVHNVLSEPDLAVLLGSGLHLHLCVCLWKEKS